MIPPEDHDLLHRHLNGDLDEREERDFLDRVGRSPELRAALAMQALDDALLSEIVREGRVRRPVPSRIGWMAVAAAGLMLASLGYILFRGTGSPRAVGGKPDPAAVNADATRLAQALERARGYLRVHKSDLVSPLEDGRRHDETPRRTYAELAALALVRSGVPESDAVVEELVGRGLGRPLESTYVAAIRASLLAELAPRRDRLRQCAQFLVDSQCANGQWDYGRALPLEDLPTEGVVRRRRTGPPDGDNSVTGFAIQGLLACHLAGVEIEPDVLHRTRRWWLSCQNPDGGWGYGESGKDDRATTPILQNTTNSSYGSMTASGLAALGALRVMLGRDPAAEEAVRKGIAWLGAHFAVEVNPGKASGFCHLSWLESAKQAGTLLGAPQFGLHDWRAEGTRFLLSRQTPAGGWAVEEGPFMKGEKAHLLDTCFAILFLSER
jgi:hypothetical protein